MSTLWKWQHLYNYAIKVINKIQLINLKLLIKTSLTIIKQKKTPFQKHMERKMAKVEICRKHTWIFLIAPTNWRWKNAPKTKQFKIELCLEPNSWVMEQVYLNSYWINTSTKVENTKIWTRTELVIN